MHSPHVPIGAVALELEVALWCLLDSPPLRFHESEDALKILVLVSRPTRRFLRSKARPPFGSTSAKPTAAAPPRLQL